MKPNSASHQSIALPTRRSFLKGVAVASAASTFPTSTKSETPRAAYVAAPKTRERRADVVIIGGSLGGVAAALAAARMGCSVILTEETRWIGGQCTSQAVPLDEHPWVESYGSTETYREFRQRVRDFYRRNYALTAEARADRHLNPGAGWVSALGFEPRVGLAVLYEMLAPYCSAGKVMVLTRHQPISVAMEGDHVRAVIVKDEGENELITLSGHYVLDATELGELIELGKIESAIGAESQSDTGEPNALEGPANPRDQMAPTHVFAVDYLPGEEHVIARPRDYDYWRASGTAEKPKIVVPNLFGVAKDYFNQPVAPNRYLKSAWSFRRMLAKGNFAAGVCPSDITVAVWNQNEFHDGIFYGVSAEERRRSMESARQLSLSVLYWLQTEAPNETENRKGFPGLRPRGDFLGTSDGLAQYPYIRESCRIKAEFTVLEQHFRTDLPATKNGPVKYSDSVGLSGYRIDIHKPDTKAASKGPLTDTNHGRHWCQQIPLGALIPVRVENLIPACKNLGVTAVTNGSFRVHPTEWNIGEAAGSLAAFCVARKLTPRQVRNTAKLLEDFQREIVRNGIELDWPANQTSRSYYSHHNLEIKDGDTFYFGEAWRLQS